MTSPDDIALLVNNIAQIIKQITVRVYPPSSQIRRLDLELLIRFLRILLLLLVLPAQYDLLRLNVLLKDAHNALNLVLPPFIIVQGRHLTLGHQLRMDELDVALIVDDVLVLVNEPAGRIHRSPIPIHLPAVDVLQNHGLVVVLVLEVAEALVRVEVEPLHSEGQGQLVFVVVVQANQLVVREHRVERVL